MKQPSSYALFKYGKQIRRDAIDEAFFAAQRVQMAFLHEDGAGFENLPDRKDEVKWLLRMANEMTAAIQKLMVEDNE